MNRRIVLLAGAAALGAAAVIAIGLVLAPGSGPEAAANVLVNEPAPIDANNSPLVVRNPLDPDNVVIVHRVDRPGFDAHLSRSGDGGQTWSRTTLLLPEGLDRAFAPDAAFGPDGRLHVSYVNLTGPGNQPENLWLAQSEDGGATLSEPVRVAGALTFQPRLAVGGDGIIHLTWLEPTELGLLALPGPATVVATHSHDDGETFGEPVAVSDPDERPRVGAAVPVIDANDNPLVLYTDFGDDIIDYEGIPDAGVFEGTFTLLVGRSPNGGDDFADSVVVDDGLVPTERFLVFLPPFPSMAVAPDGTLHVVYSDGRDGSLDVRISSSTDWASTWSAPVVVNDNPADDGTDQFLPAVDVAPDGRVDVLFLDRSGDPDNVMTSTTLASSTDGGQTFTSMNVADQVSDSRVGSSSAPFLPIDIGSRIGLDSTDQGVVAAWTDTRFGSEVDGRQDIVAAVVTRAPGAAGRARMIGLLLVVIAAIAILVSRMALGRQPAPADD